jgi:Replication initiator protein A
MNHPIAIKDDINFLENPTWIIDEKSNVKEYTLKKESGIYQIKGTEGLPNRFDRIVLYYLLHKLFEPGVLKNNELTTTRYTIAKAVFFNKHSIGTTEYERINKALHKWAGITIKFEGVFYESDSYTHRIFHILDDVIFDAKTRALSIRFNQQYIKQLQESKFYKFIHFDEYKLLTRPVAARLYELLIKTFKDRNTWHIDITKLAEKVTIEKRSNAKNYYPSDLLPLFKPAIHEINKNTSLEVTFEYDKQSDLCVFRKVAKPLSFKPAQLTSAIAKSSKIASSSTITSLMALGITQAKANELIERYSQEKIKHKLELLQQSKQAIKNVTAWLTKALDEDWDAQAYNKQVAEQELKQERAKIKAQQEADKKRLEQLKLLHQSYKEKRGQEVYDALALPVQEFVNTQFATWLEQHSKAVGTRLLAQQYKLGFLVLHLLTKEEANFDLWAATHTQA